MIEHTTLTDEEMTDDMVTETGSYLIKRDFPSPDWYDWRWQYRHRFHKGEQLAELLGYPPSLLGSYRELIRFYPFCITPYYHSLIDRDDENDPVAKQCIPDLREMEPSSASVEDPLAEEENMPVPGLVHRFSDRCLIMVTNVCHTYCRHCNRKRRWREKARAVSRDELLSMKRYLSQKPEVREVIISGGDPLSLNEGYLDWLIGELRSLPNIEVIRIGSRMPVVMPMRITKRLCRMLQKHRPLWFNTQFNHVKEITAESARACDMLLTSGIPISNQSVLLKGVNDSYEGMRSLLYGLQRIGVKPYYLFQGDAVAGTDHLRTDISLGVRIMEKLRRNISGLCLPRYVLDTPGKEGKIPLGPASLPASPNIT